MFGFSTPSKPLFGTPAPATSSASTAPVSSPFGTSTPSLFGTPSTRSSSASPFGTIAPSLFTTPSSSSSPFATTTPSLFGTPSTRSSSASPFGTTAPSLYTTPSASSSPFATTTPSLFATPSSSTSTTTSSLFSNQSSTATATTNAAPISSTSLFSPQSSTATATTNTTPLCTPSLFATQSSISTATTNTTPLSTPSLFATHSSATTINTTPLSASVATTTTASVASSFSNIFSSSASTGFSLTSTPATSAPQSTTSAFSFGTSPAAAATTPSATSSKSSFSFSTTTTATSTTQPLFGFTNAPSTTATTAATSPLFSTITSTTPAASVSAASTPLFSTSTTASPAASVSATSTASFTLPAFATPSTSSAASSSFTGFASATASTGAASFTGFCLSTKTAAPATPSHPQSTTAAAPLFGTSASTSAATTASSSGASTTQTLSLAVASSSGTTLSVSTTVSAAIKLPSEITGKTVEEIIKEWNAELQECTGKFRKQAAAIVEWDKRILQNRDVFLKLEIEVAKVVETQANLERQLELIETHQQEVDKALESIEEEAERIYKDDHGLLLDDEAASTRDAMYEQAEFVERELEQMTEKIKSVIQTLNANQDGELDAIDGMTPLDEVVRILNNQLSSLMWIDEKPTTPSKQPSLSQVLRDMEDDFVPPPSSPLPPTHQAEAITIEESDDEDQLTLQEGLLAQDNKNKKQVTGETIPTDSPQIRETPRDEEATTKVTHMPLSSSLVATSLPQASNVLEVPISSGFVETSAPVSEREKPSESTFAPTTTPSISGKLTPEKDFDGASKLQALSSQTAEPIDPHLSPVEVSPVELSDDFLRRNVQQAQMRASSYLTRSDSGSSEELLPPLDTQLIVGLSHGQAAVELPRSDVIFLDPPPEAFSQHSTHLMELLNCTADLKEFMSRFMDKDSWQAISFLRKLPGVPTQIHFCLRLIAENWRFANSACGDFYRKGFPEALHFSLHRVRVVQNGKKDECQQSIIATKERICLLEEQLAHERNELAALEARLQGVIQDEVVAVRKEIIRQISSVSFNTRSSCRDALEQVVQWCMNPRSED